MLETQQNHSSQDFVHHIETYTLKQGIHPPLLQDESGNWYRDDTHILDAVSFLRRGILELREMDGEQGTLDQLNDYVFTGTNDRTSFSQWDIQEAIEKDRLEKATTPEQEQAAYRDSVLLVDRNTQDGIIGVLEGRIYTYAGTGDKALLINWVVTSNSGIDDDSKGYRRSGVGIKLYQESEKLAREKGIELLIAAVNPENTASTAFHKRNGFLREEFDPSKTENGVMAAHKTEHGAFMPPYIFESEDGAPPKVAEYYTKRLVPFNQE